MAMNNSAGILSSSSKEIKADLNMNDKQFGMFGTSNGLGRVIGCFLFTILVNNFNRKWTFVFFTTIKSVLLVLFKFTNVGWILITCRGFIGLTHMPPSIYIPVWIDQFGLKMYKTMFMTLLQVVIPLGKVEGYALTNFYGPNNWQMGFVTEGLYLFAVAVFITVTPMKFFSAKLVAVKDDELETKFQIKKKESVSIFEVRKSLTKSSKNEQSTFAQAKAIITNPVFFFSNLARAILQGVNTALHYWISDYMRTALNIEDKSLILFAYTIVSIAGPIGGILASGFSNFFLGGYEHKHAPLALLMFHIITCVCGLCIPFMGGLYSFCGATMMFLVFSSSAVPMIHGIILNSVGPKLKGMAFSITNFTTMLLTSGPYPFMYGAVNDYFKPEHKNYAMLAIMLSECIGIIFILILAYFRYKTFDDSKKKKEKLVTEGEELQEKA